MILKKNVGYTDSIIRVVLGVLIVGAGLAFESFWGFIGLIPIISGGIAFCPIYRWMGKETSRPDSERAY
ncbi:MAG: DUF2892 domain-containing protein [Balneolaceae bacterium]|nr:DUF2892 domain-containing protein [Balneolaceae bacterium]MCH8548306.1 DUF2892 domain-containing protein [Balneolaceae bacterium]